MVLSRLRVRKESCGVEIGCCLLPGVLPSFGISFAYLKPTCSAEKAVLWQLGQVLLKIASACSLKLLLIFLSQYSLVSELHS